MENLHCIKCGEEMEAHLEMEGSVLSVCTNRKCILLGVPQVGQEKLDEYFEKSKKNTRIKNKSV